MPKISLEGKSKNVFNEFVRFILDVYLAGDIKHTSDSFYEKASYYAHSLDPLVVAKTIYYFRKNVGPSYIVSLLQVIVMLKIPTKQWGRKFYSAVLKTTIEAVEIYEILLDKKFKLTMAMKNGYAYSLSNFTEKDFALLTWDEAVILKGFINFVHPRRSRALDRFLNQRIKNISREKIEINYDAIDLITKDINSDINDFILMLNSLEFD